MIHGYFNKYFVFLYTFNKLFSILLINLSFSILEFNAQR